MHRRQVLAELCGTGPILLAGCSTALRPSGTTDETATRAHSTADTASDTATPAVLGTSDDPWLGDVVHLSGDSASDVEEVFDEPVRRVLVGHHVRSVFVEGRNVKSIEEQVQRSPYTVESVVSVEWTYGSVCEMGSRILVPNDVEEARLKSAFPNALSISEAATPQGGRFWLVYGRQLSRTAIETRLQSLGVDEESATVYVYTDCRRLG
jgi:hypothetical protein